MYYFTIPLFFLIYAFLGESEIAFAKPRTYHAHGELPIFISKKLAIDTEGFGVKLQGFAEGICEDIWWDMNENFQVKDIVMAYELSLYCDDELVSENKMWIEAKIVMEPAFKDDMPTFKAAIDSMQNIKLAGLPIHFYRFTGVINKQELATFNHAKPIKASSSLSYLESYLAYNLTNYELTKKFRTPSSGDEFLSVFQSILGSPRYEVYKKDILSQSSSAKFHQEADIILENGSVIHSTGLNFSRDCTTDSPNLLCDYGNR